MGDNALYFDIGLGTQQIIEHRLGIKLEDALSRYTPEQILPALRSTFGAFPRGNEILDEMQYAIEHGHPFRIHEKLRGGAMGWLFHGSNKRGKLIIELRFNKPGLNK